MDNNANKVSEILLVRPEQISAQLVPDAKPASGFDQRNSVLMKRLPQQQPPNMICVHTYTFGGELPTFAHKKRNEYDVYFKVLRAEECSVPTFKHSVLMAILNVQNSLSHEHDLDDTELADLEAGAGVLCEILRQLGVEQW